MNKGIRKRLNEAETKAKKRENGYMREVLECMSTEELRELIAMYDNDEIDERRHDEIWERAENEYKQRHIKADKSG